MDLRESKEALKHTQNAARRAAMRVERMGSLPDGVDLVGLKDLHVFDLIRIPGLGISVNPEGLKAGAFLLVFIYMVLYISDVPWNVSAILAILVSLLGIWDKARKAHDGLVMKEGKLRVAFDDKQGKWVRARAVVAPHTDRMLFVSGGVEYSYSQWVQMHPDEFGVGANQHASGE